MYIYGRTDTLDTPAGIFTDCIRMLFDVPQVIDEEQWYVFAPDVGLVEYYGAWQPTTTLYQAVVDGVHYPKSTAAVAQHRDTPTYYSLFKTYPNPFNPLTTLAYELPETAPVTLTIYDILGRIVIRLVDDRLLAAGYNQVTWDGRDGEGIPVPSGIYIARLVTPAYTSSVKMLLLK